MRDVLEQLVRIRVQNGLSQADVARRMYVSRPNITKLEGGKHIPRLDMLTRYAAAVGAELRVVRAEQRSAL